MRVVSTELEKVRVEQYHCQGLRTVIQSYIVLSCQQTNINQFAHFIYGLNLQQPTVHYSDGHIHQWPTSKCKSRPGPQIQLGQPWAMPPGAESQTREGS